MRNAMATNVRRALATLTLGLIGACSPPPDSATATIGAAAASGEPSVGRGRPVPVELGPYDGYPEELFVGSVTPWYYEYNPTATGGNAPEGVTPLERDLFTSDDFYADRDLWMDPRYYRCNSPIALDSIRGDYASGPSAVDNDDPTTAAWGHCDRDYPRAAMVSPYPFKTAQEHYEALLAETRAKGGPTEHTPATLPSWNGRYTRNLNLAFARGRRGGEGTDLPQEYIEPPQWVVGWANQMPTLLSLLTPEYQERFVQQMYHKANTNASQASLMFCRPEGLMRWWTGSAGPSQLDVMVVPGRVQFMGGNDNALRQVQVGRTFNMEGAVPHLGQDVRRWLGETVGFWDGNALITWTSNVQGWFTHGSWEHSSSLQLIEIWSERHDAGGTFIGLEHETIFYDPEAYVEPVRDIRFFVRRGEFAAFEPIAHQHCNQTIFLGEDGRPTQVPPGTTIQLKVRDLYDRPWARVYEEYFEQNMSRPVEDDSLGGFR
jgi:hypothetical protein